MNKEKYYSPVLLYQGFDQESVVPGQIQTFNYQFSQDRGFVKALDIIGLYPEDDLNDNPYIFNLVVNSQTLLKNMNWSNFAYYKTSGLDDEELIKCRLNERGTAELRVNNNIAPGTPATARLQFVAYYTTPEHDDWLRTFKWGEGLGLKQQSYLLTVPAGTLPTDIQPNIEVDLSTGNGDIIGYSISCASQDRNVVVLREFNVYENGQQIIEKYNGMLALPSSGRKDWIFKKLTSPGSTLKFECSLLSTANVDEYYYITVYFAN